MVEGTLKFSSKKMHRVLEQHSDSESKHGCHGSGQISGPIRIMRKRKDEMKSQRYWVGMKKK